MVAMLTLLVLAKSNQRMEVNEQLRRIFQLQKETGVKLSGNEQFHQHLIETGPVELPGRLERFSRNLNRQNMQRRLFAIYKWNVGRDEASRPGFPKWLAAQADWLSEQGKETEQK